MSWLTSIIEIFKGAFTPYKEPPTTTTDGTFTISGESLLTVFEQHTHPTPPDPVPVSEDDAIIESLSTDYQLNSKLVKAIAQVESSGKGLREYKGLGLYPTLRFEPHWFNKFEKKSPMPFTNNGKGFSSVASETNHVAYQKALAVNKKAAIKSTSFGKFQIMGFHFNKFGFATPEDFLESLKTLRGQYDAFLKFVLLKPSLKFIVMKENPNITDFKTFARYYNGTGNVDAYSKRIEKAYNSLA